LDAVYNSFAAGELAPELAGATGLPIYYQGCRTVENEIVKPTGGLCRRPGLEFIAEVKNSANATRIVPFVNKTDAYILEFSNLVMRAFHDGALVTSGGGAYELVTPYTSAQVFDLVVGPRGQALFHGSHDPRELVCGGDASWTLTAFASQYGPFLPANTDTANTITPSATTGSITLTAVKDTFLAGHVGSLWELTHLVDEVSLTGRFANATEPPFTQNATSSTSSTIKGRWDLTIHWHGWGKLKLQRSTDGTVWKTIKTWDKPLKLDQLVITDSGEELEDGVSFRFYMDWASAGDPDALYDSTLLVFRMMHVPGNLNPPNVEYSLRAKNTAQTGIVRITSLSAITPTKIANATVLNALGAAAATDEWREGAWNGVRGYPARGTIHDSRIYAARTSYQPTTIWAGRPFLRRSDARLFYAGSDVTADDAITRTVDLKELNDIRWLESLWVMLVGGDASLTKCLGPTEQQPMTPIDFNAIPQSGMGSSSLQPVMISDHVVYAGRSNERIYEMTYSDDARSYEPEDLTEFAEHFGARGIAGWAFQQQPYPILWVWFDDGTFASLTRRRAAQQKAWAHHTTDGSVECIAVIPGAGNDEVWFVVARTVNGATKRYVERMKPFGTYTGGTLQRDCFYVDSGTKWGDMATTAITGIAVAAGTGRVTVTSASHGRSNGETVRLAAVGGMVEVNGHVYTVADKTDDAFVLKTRDGSAYIDGGAFTAYTSGGTVDRVSNTVTGLTHLAGETVAVLLDGQPTTGTVTAAGVYTVGTGKDRYYHNTIIVGRPYTSILQPMRPEARTVSGSLQGRKKRVVNCSVRLYQSAGGKVGSSTDDCGDIDYHEDGRTVGDDVELVSRDVPAPCPGGWDDDGDIWLETDTPLPMTVLALLYELE